MDEYGYCLLDHHKERIGNFKIEPPGLFRGRGEHPKQGMLKKRIQPEDVTINCSKWVGTFLLNIVPIHIVWKHVKSKIITIYKIAYYLAVDLHQQLHMYWWQSGPALVILKECMLNVFFRNVLVTVVTRQFNIVEKRGVRTAACLCRNCSSYWNKFSFFQTTVCP